MKKIKWIISLMFILIVFIGQGCDSTVPSNSKEDIEKRVHALMTAKVNGDWKLVYTFFDENYKSKTPETRFSTPRPIQFVEYEIQGIEMDSGAKKASVKVKHSILIKGMTVEGIDDQNWIVEKNEWVLAAIPGDGF